MNQSLLSPGVRATERDLSLIVPTTSNLEGAFVGQFNWGPVEQPTLIDSEAELLETFWKPTNENSIDWFTASNYLSYSDKLWLVRMVDDNAANTSLRATNATASNNSGFLVKNDEIYNEMYDDGELKLSHNTGDWIARYPGDLGNSIKVSVCSSEAAFSSTLTGTVTVVKGANSVIGVGTQFTTELVVGDFIVIANEVHKVSTITSNTALTIETRHVAGASAVTASRRWEYFFEVDTAPSTSVYTQTLGGSNDEMHVIIVDEDGLITGQKNTVLEKYQYISKARDAKLPNGTVNYYKEVINQRSNWIRWAGHDSLTNIGNLATGTTFGTATLPKNYSFVGGKTGAPINNDERIRGWDFFKSDEDYEVSLLLGGDADTTLAVHLINNIAEVRKDCLVYLSPPRAYVVNNKGREMDDCITFRNTLPSTSYAALDGNWKYQYDRYNDVYRYIPCNADTAGIHVRSSVERDDWWAAAGLNRGHVKNAIRLAWNPRQADRDMLYKNSINPVVVFKGEGAVLFGQKTLLNKPSAFDRINVRRLFIALRKSISRMSKYFLFEFNDPITQAQFRNIVNPYLRDIQGRRGVQEFYVQCDSTNNTPERVDRNEFHASIYIKPTRVAEFIYLDFVALRSGVEFAEVVTTVPR